MEECEGFDDSVVWVLGWDIDFWFVLVRNSDGRSLDFDYSDDEEDKARRAAKPSVESSAPIEADPNKTAETCEVSPRAPSLRHRKNGQYSYWFSFVYWKFG